MIELKDVTDALLAKTGRTRTRSVVLQLDEPEIDLTGIPPAELSLDDLSADLTIADVGQDDADEWGYHVSLGVGGVLRNVPLRLELVDEAPDECRVRETDERILNGPRWKLSGGDRPDWTAPVTVAGTVRRTAGAMTLEEGGRTWVRLG